MAPVSALAGMEPAEVIRRMQERLDREPREDAGLFWSATGILMGLRFRREEIIQLLRGVRGMKESSFYQMILEEGEALGMPKGRVEEARRILLIIGRDRWGEPDPPTAEAIDSLVDVGRLEALIKRAYRAASWEELLAVPPAGE